MAARNRGSDGSVYANNAGTRLLRQVVEAVGPIFTVEEARAVAEGATVALSQVPIVLHRLASSGWVVRLKRGVYAAQPPVADGELHPYAIATALVSPAAISHWSAAAHHGLTTQIPSMVQASTPKAIVTPEMRSGGAHSPRGRPVWLALGVECEYIRVQLRHYYGHDEEWVDRWHRIAITDRERTLLDMVADPGVFGSLQTALEALASQLGNIDLRKLVGYTLHYDVGTVIKRVGWALDELGVPEELLQPLLDRPTLTYTLLDVTGAPHGTANARWRIYENLKAT